MSVVSLKISSTDMNRLIHEISVISKINAMEKKSENIPDYILTTTDDRKLKLYKYTQTFDSNEQHWIAELFYLDNKRGEASWLSNKTSKKFNLLLNIMIDAIERDGVVTQKD
jgi:hypothetical protein